jgi:hypothetical protein
MSAAARSDNLVYAKVCRLALNLARNCGYAVLPCSAKGQPLIPIHDASKVPSAISNTWVNTPGPLIGIATGAVSDIWVLEISDEASGWWRGNNGRLLPTRCYQTPESGVHCYYCDGRGIASSTNRIAPGVNTRGDGDFVIHWFSAGQHCHDHSTPAPWPQWLRDVLGTPA